MDGELRTFEEGVPGSGRFGDIGISEETLMKIEQFGFEPIRDSLRESPPSR